MLRRNVIVPRVVELVDTLDSKSDEEIHAGSNPVAGTIIYNKRLYEGVFY